MDNESKQILCLIAGIVIGCVVTQWDMSEKQANLQEQFSQLKEINEGLIEATETAIEQFDSLLLIMDEMREKPDETSPGG